MKKDLFDIENDRIMDMNISTSDFEAGLSYNCDSCSLQNLRLCS